MLLRPLGRSGLHVAPLAFGANVFGWTVDEPTAFRLLDAWTDAGLNLVDTADVYPRWVPGNVGGESETVIGNWLGQGGGRRERIVLATKVGKDMGDGRKGLAPAYIRRAVEDSLRRLKTDRIDLYQSHDDDASVPLADTLGAYARLIEEGKVRAIGASNFTALRLAEALDVSRRFGLPRYETLQPLYNLCDRAPFEDALAAVCAEHGLGVISFYGLARGFLTGKYRSPADAAKSPRGAAAVAAYLDPRGLRILGALDAVAARHPRANPTRVALAWLMARPGVTAPIASATSLAQLDDLVAATQLVLDADDLDALDRASA